MQGMIVPKSTDIQNVQRISLSLFRQVWGARLLPILSKMWASNFHCIWHQSRAYYVMNVGFAGNPWRKWFSSISDIRKEWHCLASPFFGQFGLLVGIGDKKVCERVTAISSDICRVAALLLPHCVSFRSGEIEFFFEYRAFLKANLGTGFLWHGNWRLCLLLERQRRAWKCIRLLPVRNNCLALQIYIVWRQFLSGFWTRWKRWNISSKIILKASQAILQKTRVNISVSLQRSHILLAPSSAWCIRIWWKRQGRLGWLGCWTCAKTFSGCGQSRTWLAFLILTIHRRNRPWAGMHWHILLELNSTNVPRRPTWCNLSQSKEKFFTTLLSRGIHSGAESWS